MKKLIIILGVLFSIQSNLSAQDDMKNIIKINTVKAEGLETFDKEARICSFTFKESAKIKLNIPSGNYEYLLKKKGSKIYKQIINTDSKRIYEDDLIVFQKARPNGPNGSQVSCKEQERLQWVAYRKSSRFAIGQASANQLCRGVLDCIEIRCDGKITKFVMIIISPNNGCEKFNWNANLPSIQFH